MSDEHGVHVGENRTYWDGMAETWVAPGRRAWQSEAPYWGIWHLPERELRLLPEDLSGKRAIELGCGTGYVSAWLTRRGARVVAIDNSAKQLATAEELAREHGLDITWLHGNAETVPEPDASFDFAISEYGAAIWCDPYLWIPEATRLLRSGGELVFLGNHPLQMVCSPHSGANCDTTLHRSWFDLHQIDWREVAIDPGGIEFNLPISKWLALFRDSGFEMLDYLELKAPEAAKGDQFMVNADWAKRWPCEQVFKLRKR